MEPTLGQALTAAFGQAVLPGQAGVGSGTGTGGTGTGTGTTGGATGTVSAQAAALIARANTEFDAAQTALKAGDFAGYGDHIKALQQALTDLQRLQQK